FHSHGYKFNVLIGGCPRYIRKLPLVVTLHGYVKAHIFSKMWLYQALDKMFIRRADSVVLVNEGMRRVFSVTSGISRLRVIDNGIDVPIAPYPDANDPVVLRFIRNYRFIILAIGRLAPEKGFDILIRAVSPLLQVSQDVGVLIIGDGGERSRLEQL